MDSRLGSLFDFQCIKCPKCDATFYYGTPDDPTNLRKRLDTHRCFKDMTHEEFWSSWDSHMVERGHIAMTTPWVRVEELVKGLQPTMTVDGVEDFGNRLILHLVYTYPGPEGSITDITHLTITPDGKVLLVSH